MKTDRPAMHMVFTGNSGTAKTSVARLFAKIMKENNLLSKGNLIEVGRGDLVGKYVGWTAPTIQKNSRKPKAACCLSMKHIPLSMTEAAPLGMKQSTPLCRKWKTTGKMSLSFLPVIPIRWRRFCKRTRGFAPELRSMSHSQTIVPMNLPNRQLDRIKKKG